MEILCVCFCFPLSKSGDYDVKLLCWENDGQNILMSNAITPAFLEGSCGVLISLTLDWEQGSELDMHGGCWKGKASQRE